MTPATRRPAGASSPHPVQRRRAAALARLAPFVLLAGCAVWSNDAVRITVSFAGNTPQARLRSLTVVAGSDRYSWDALDSGDSRNVNLLPGAADDRRLTFLYTLDDQVLTWEGPAIPTGAGYRIAIAVDAQGRVTARHCLLPCRLE